MPNASLATLPNAFEEALSRKPGGLAMSPAVSGGDGIAELFERSATLVHRTAHRITGNAADAEDVLQGVFLGLLQRGVGAPPPRNAVGFLKASAVNASLDILRRRRRRTEEPVDEARQARSLREEESHALGHVAGRELAERLRDALLLLSPLEAEVFALSAFEELTNSEIAESTDRTPNHVGVTLHAARTKLKAALAHPPAPGARNLTVSGD